MGSCIIKQRRLRAIDKALTSHNVNELHVRGKAIEKSFNDIEVMFKEIDSIYKYTFNILPRLKIEKSSLYVRRQKILPQKLKK